MTKEYVTIQQGAEILGVSVKTIYNYLNKDLLDLYRTKGKKPLLCKENVLDLLEPRLVKK